MRKRRWKSEEKAAILQEGGETDVLETCRKYNISRATFYKWKQALDDGKSGDPSGGARVNLEMKRLQEENKRLKQLLAEKELILSIKEELLKKNASRK
jgi:putative transposase